MVGGGGGGPLRRVGKYEVGRTIGEGTFAKVKFAQNTETGESVAMKVLDRSSILKNKMAEQVTELASFFFARWVGTWDGAGSRAAPASPPNNVDELGWIARYLHVGISILAMPFLWTNFSSLSKAVIDASRTVVPCLLLLLSHLLLNIDSCSTLRCTAAQASWTGRCPRVTQFLFAD
jgi:serine/threonine protein kinase